MKIWDRKNQSYIEEIEFGKNKLCFLYKTVIGRILLWSIFSRAWYANLEAKCQQSKHSACKIAPFTEKYKVDMTAYKGQEYRCFRDFFLRKREIRESVSDETLVAIADSRLKVYTLTKDSVLSIKNSKYEIRELIEDNETALKYADGTCLVFRLAVQDYHRYMYVDEGELIKQGKIKGVLHTIRPISEKYHVFARNTRTYSLLKTKQFGEVLQIEVGALLVGKIINHDKKQFKKLEEKGYFDYGGSTILLLFEKGKIQIDKEIQEQSKKDIETLVTIGEGIGRRCLKD